MKNLLSILFVFLNCSLQAQTLTRGPYLQNGGKTSVTVRWRTDVPATSKISLGTALGVYTITAADNQLLTEHIITVKGLTEGTKYYYTIAAGNTILQGDAYNFFTTAPADTSTQKITIAAFGDCGRNENNYQTNSLNAYRNYMQAKGMQAADIMLLLGDNAYQNGVDTEYRDNFFSAYQSNILKNHILFPAPGNHEYANASARQKDHNIDYFNIFSVPDSGQCGGVASHNKAYYSFNRGNIHFLSLDSYGEEDEGTTRLYDTNGKQVQWIKADLAANSKKWTIAFWHHPPYTMGNHNSDIETELVKIRQNFIQLLERNGVDVVLCGHSHNYERSHLMRGYYGDEASYYKTMHTVDSSSGKYDGTTNSCPYVYASSDKNHGTVYVVSGSAGAAGTVQAGYPHNAMPFSQHDGGMFYIEIENKRLDAKFIRQDGVIADKFTIMKDAGRKDTITIPKGGYVTLRASWQGNYYWSTGNFGHEIIDSPPATSTYTVKDDKNNTCLTDEITVQVNAGTRAYPIPALNSLYVEINALQNDEYTFTVYNVAGMNLYSRKMYLQYGLHRLTLPLEGISAGQQLFLKISGNNNTETLRFVKL